MKTKITLLAVIAILAGALVYQAIQSHRATLGHAQFDLAVFTQLYHNLDRGEVDAAKQRLGALVTVTVDGIQQHYGQEADTKFALMLPDAKVIKTAFETKSSLSK
jgi:hypothetical protein